MGKKRFDDHQLFYFSTCPYCIRVRMAMMRMGLEMPLKNIHSDPQYQTELIAGGGKKQVPCLRIEDSQGNIRWLYESGDIIRYLKQKCS